MNDIAQSVFRIFGDMMKFVNSNKSIIKLRNIFYLVKEIGKCSMGAQKIVSIWIVKKFQCSLDFLSLAARARAYLEGRDYVIGTDVQAVFRDVCGHRVLLRESASGRGVLSVLEDLLKTVENPDRYGLKGLLKR